MDFAKEILYRLQTVKGYASSVVTLVIPPQTDWCGVKKNIHVECHTATHIKNKKNSKAVQSALKMILEKMSLYKRTPTTGIAFFSGSYV
jgi:peptide chain release factor subunit 1